MLIMDATRHSRADRCRCTMRCGHGARHIDGRSSWMPGASAPPVSEKCRALFRHGTSRAARRQGEHACGCTTSAQLRPWHPTRAACARQTVGLPGGLADVTHPVSMRSPPTRTAIARLIFPPCLTRWPGRPRPRRRLRRRRGWHRLPAARARGHLGHAPGCLDHGSRRHVGTGSSGTRCPQHSMRDVRQSPGKTDGLPRTRGSCWMPGSWLFGGCATACVFPLPPCSPACAIA